jgi:molybdopterin-guanine dinucleotide biosynthesis protein A
MHVTPATAGKPMYHHAMHDISAFLLAGGRSTRMGQDKAFLEVGGVTLLDRTLSLARSAATKVFIVGEATKFSSFAPVIEDQYRDRGPLGGIHAALKATTTEANLILAIDLPFLRGEFLQCLIVESQANHAVATVPECGGHLHPLCAIYLSSFGNVAEQALLRGENKIDALFSKVETHVISQADLFTHGFSPDMFHNLNTPEDFDSVESKTL